MLNDKVWIGSGPLIEKSILLALIFAVGWACLRVLAPFVAPFLWAVILVVSTWPLYQRVVSWLNGRRFLAALGMTLLILLVLAMPTWLAFNEAAEKLPHLGALATELAQLRGDHAPGWLAELPGVGENIDAAWRNGRLQGLLDPPKIRAAASAVADWLLHAGADLALAAIHVLLATLIAGLLYPSGARSAELAARLARRVGGNRLLNIVSTAAHTVRGVALGVIGTALVQALLFVAGFLVAGVPSATLLGLACFLGAVAHVGTFLIWIPVALWQYGQGHEGWALFTTVWGIAVSVLDHVLKPYLIGRATPLPFLLIFLGVIGGLLAWGFVGIFLGTTLLAVAYSGFLDWLDHPASEDPPAPAV